MKLEPTLGDLGERTIVAEVLGPRYSVTDQFGDDCAWIATDAEYSHIVATTDPCPPPMAHHLGFIDPFYAGWLTAAINLSDIAAAGAVPLGILTSFILPTGMLLADFERLLDGVDACCASSSTSVKGGNIKEGKSISLAATAIGGTHSAPFGRSGAKEGDFVLELGEFGLFWAGVLAHSNGLIDPLNASAPLLRNVLTPQPMSEIMPRLAQRGLISAAIDNSDGLAPTLRQLAESSSCSITIDADEIAYSNEIVSVANELSVDPFRLALGWGDWNVIVTANSNDLAEIRTICSGLNVPVQVIGKVTAGSGVHLRIGAKSGVLGRFESERFAKDSWMDAGVDGYLANLQNGSFFAN